MKILGTILVLLLLAAGHAQAGKLVWTHSPGYILKTRFYITALDGPAPRSWTLDYPLYFVSATGDTTWRSHGGMQDTLSFTGSCRSAPVHYTFMATEWNKIGESTMSNGGVPVSMVILP